MGSSQATSSLGFCLQIVEKLGQERLPLGPDSHTQGPEASVPPVTAKPSRLAHLSPPDPQPSPPLPTRRRALFRDPGGWAAPWAAFWEAEPLTFPGLRPEHFAHSSGKGPGSAGPPGPHPALQAQQTLATLQLALGSGLSKPAPLLPGLPTGGPAQASRRRH